MNKIMLFNEKKLSAFQKIHSDLKQIISHEKCRTCSCLYNGVLASISDKISCFFADEFRGQIEIIRKDFETWVKDAALLQAHG
jgi:hypothetical protein